MTSLVDTYVQLLMLCVNVDSVTIDQIMTAHSIRTNISGILLILELTLKNTFTTPTSVVNFIRITNLFSQWTLLGVMVTKLV